MYMSVESSVVNVTTADVIAATPKIATSWYMKMVSGKASIFEKM